MSSSVDLGRAAAARAELITRADIAAWADRAPAAQLPARRRRTAADVMTPHPVTVDHDASMWTAWDRLRAEHSGHVVLVDDHRRPVGVLDERTIALEWPPGPLGAHRTPVYDLLRDRLRPRVRGGTDVRAVARTMLDARADAVPVVDRAGQLSGLITLWHFAELTTDGSDEEPPRGTTTLLPDEG